jgi:hypothetical protein
MFDEDEEDIVTGLPEGAILVTPVTPEVALEVVSEPIQEDVEETLEVPAEQVVMEIPEGARLVEQAMPEQDEVVAELPENARPLPRGTPNDYPSDLFQGDYGPSALKEGRRFKIVDNFLSKYYGTDDMDKFTEEEKVDQFLRTWRYVESGNSINTVGFVDFVLSTDDSGRRAVAEAHDLFRGMAGVGRGVYSGEETLQAIGSYAWGAIADPVNVVAPMFGRLFAQAGTKASSRVALEIAKKTALEQVAKNVAQPLAIASANAVKGTALREAVKATGRKEAFKEVMGATAFDTAVAVGTDIAYQHGLIESGAQEEQDRIQTGLAALGGLVGGAISAGGVAVRRGPRDAALAATDIKPMSVRDAADLSGVLEELTGELKKIPKVEYTEGFTKKVKRGTELEAVDTTFWGKLLAGDPDTDFKGLGKILYEKGFRYSGKRSEEDNFSNWLADVMINAPAKEGAEFAKVFQEVTGVRLKGMSKAPAIKELADNMAKKMSDSGRAMGYMGRTSKLLRSDIERLTPEDYGRVMFGDLLDEDVVLAEPSFVQKLGAGVSERVDYFQSTYIRALVTHPGTSALNVIGWSAKSAGQSASDILQATLVYGSSSAISALKFQGADAARSWGKMTGVYKANLRKMANLVDPYTTHLEFTSLVESNPKSFKDVTGILPGGVLKAAADEYGLTPKGPFYQETTEKALGFFQTLGFVKAQDAFSKSQEVMYNLDVLLRQSNLGEGNKGLTYRELVARPDAAVVVSTKEYQAIQAKAIDLSLENIMSKSYKQQTNVTLKSVAGLIEDARQIPVVGVHVPFGRFFNNVVATTSEYSGLTLALKGAGTGVGANKSVSELSAKALVGYVTVASLVPRELELLERGVAWNEEVDDTTGQRTDEKYNAPAIAAKWAARLVAHYLRDGEAPKALVDDGSKAVFGQLTRQLTESGEAIVETAQSLLRGDGVEAMAGLSAMLMASGATVTSGATRFLDPVNTMVALGQSSENYAPPDIKTGNKALLFGFRNLDQIIEAVSGPVDALDRQAPVGDFVSRQPGRSVGIRTVGPQTSASRVFASIGQPQWDANLYSSEPTANNIVTKNFRPIFEGIADGLLNNPFFKKAGLDERQILVAEALKEAREITHRTMQLSGDYRNNRSTMIFKLAQSNSVEALEGYMSEIGMGDMEIQELTTEQLEVLKYFIDNDKDIKIERLYRS